MKKLSFSLALLLGLSGTASAQTEELVVTDIGTKVTSLSEFATLAEEGTWVMFYNDGRGKYMENHIYADGTNQPLLDYENPFSVNTAGNSSFLWQLVKGDNENEYYLKSYADGKYLYMYQAGTYDYYTTTVTTTSTDSVDTYYIHESGEEGIFYFASSNVNDDAATLTENGYSGTVLLNGDNDTKGSTIVGWYYLLDDIVNSRYSVYVPTTESKGVYTVTLNLAFYDGSSDNTLQESGLSSLIPDDVDTETMTYTMKGLVGGTLEVPSFDYNDVRSITFGGTSISDTTTFVVTADMVADGATVDVAYTSYPQITFTCVIDASLVGDNDGSYLWDETSSTTQTTTSRIAVGESITVPTFDNFTAVTEIDEEDMVVSVSKTYEIRYRPWRLVYADCYYILGDTPVLFQSGYEMYVDIDSLLTGPDMGELYVFSTELTNEYGTNDAGLEIPFTVTLDNITEGMFFEFCYMLTSPITTSDVTDDGQFPDDATWYIVSLRGSKILTNETNDNGYLVLDASADIDDNSLWCFRQNADGTYYVYNRAMEGYVFCDVYNGEYPEFAEATGSEQGFELFTIGTGYGFRVPDSYYIWNDYSGAGQLAYWVSESALTDDGSTITFEEYDPANYLFLDGRAVLNAVNCLNGFDADDENIIELAGLVAELNEDYASDVTGYVYTLLEYTDEERVQYNPDHAYAIISAAPSYISKDNVKYALYVQGDSTLAWKEFNEYDRSHYFMVGNMKDLESSTGEVDSTVVTLQGVESGRYVAATAWMYAQPLGMTDELVDSICYFHLDPVDEEYDDEGTIIPAAFYIDRWWYNSNNPSSAMVLCTMCMHTGTIDSSTEGTIVSYNTRELGYANMFRFYDTGNTADVVGIGSVVNDEAVTSDGTDAIYDLTGRRVQKATKGVYIQNGKKVYVK